MLEYAPSWAKVAHDKTESFAGPVSSKGKIKHGFGFVCDNCTQKGVPLYLKILKQEVPDTSFASVPTMIDRCLPKRCKKCKSAKARWVRAKKVFIKLDELRMNEEIKYLRFLTLTRKEWNTWYPFAPGIPLTDLKKEIKKKAMKKFRNWRSRNKWWLSRNAMGQGYPEITIKGQGYIVDGSLVMGYRLHFHIHMILVSKFIDNQVIKKPVGNGDSKLFREWGGIADVAAVKDHKVPYQVNGETKYGCGRKAVMRYLTKYITKSEGYNSFKIGKW